jgi:DNA gyrase/topoisomerase IV subunit B
LAICESTTTIVADDRLAGSNFDDDQKKLTGGRNGYGAKLANIYSHEFGECK